jgi:hypothetical protein
VQGKGTVIRFSRRTATVPSNRVAIEEEIGSITGANYARGKLFYIRFNLTLHLRMSSIYISIKDVDNSNTAARKGGG